MHCLIYIIQAYLNLKIKRKNKLKKSINKISWNVLSLKIQINLKT